MSLGDFICFSAEQLRVYICQKYSVYYFVSTNPQPANLQLQSQIDALPQHLRQVVQLIGKAYSNKEIAAETGLSINTVSTYVKCALAKLGMRRGELTMQIIRLGLDQTPQA